MTAGSCPEGQAVVESSASEFVPVHSKLLIQLPIRCFDTESAQMWTLHITCRVSSMCVMKTMCYHKADSIARADISNGQDI